LKAQKKNIKLWLIALVGFGFILASGLLLLKRLEGGKPEVGLNLGAPYLNVSQTLAITVSDKESGVRRIWVGLVKDNKEVVLLEKDLPTAGILGGGKVKQETFRIKVEPRKLGITDGKAILRLVARDFAWRGWWHGNLTYIEKEVLVDTRPPDVNILTRVHNLSQGGTGLIVFKVSEPCSQQGVSVGGTFFPGHPGYFEDPNTMLAFFALDYKQGPGTEIFVKATDYAGNNTRAGFPHYIKAKTFKRDSINLSDRFLSWKMPEFDIDIPPDSKTPIVDKFLKVNRDLRQANYRQITDLTETITSEIYWSGAFLRLPRSARKSGFGESRKYKYKGSFIDQQVHLGIDLASVSQSPVPAANRGKVVLAENLGIYGKTVIIDHGFGLLSMYSHLSGFDVQEGQILDRGTIIGSTGSTGFAAGDHLHFSVLVHNTFVNPIEWWDTAWIKNNITAKLEAVKSIN